MSTCWLFREGKGRKRRMFLVRWALVGFSGNTQHPDDQITHRVTLLQGVNFLEASLNYHILRDCAFKEPFATSTSYVQSFIHKPHILLNKTNCTHPIGTSNALKPQLSLSFIVVLTRWSKIIIIYAFIFSANNSILSSFPLFSPKTFHWDGHFAPDKTLTLYT